MNTKEYLNQIKHIDKLIQSYDNELNDLKELYDSIAGTDYSKERVQESGSTTDARFTRTVEKIIELQDTIRYYKEESVNLKKEVLNVIESLDDNYEKLLLKAKYMQGKTIRDIAKELYVSERTAHNIHFKALNHVTERLLNS